jgi:hypothetical protein
MIRCVSAPGDSTATGPCETPACEKLQALIKADKKIAIKAFMYKILQANTS